jgi:hypothetical protein
MNKPRPNPLTDELSDEAKKRLAQQFADLKMRPVWDPEAEMEWRGISHNWWERNGRDPGSFSPIR